MKNPIGIVMALEGPFVTNMQDWFALASPALLGDFREITQAEFQRSIRAGTTQSNRDTSDAIRMVINRSKNDCQCA
jgi:hypothetical protein